MKTSITHDSTIYVAGRVTVDADGTSSSGEFQWRTDRALLHAIQAAWIAAGDADVSDIAEITVEQLALAPGDLTSESITAALDQWPDLWEPAYGQNRPAPAAG